MLIIGIIDTLTRECGGDTSSNSVINDKKGIQGSYNVIFKITEGRGDGRSPSLYILI